VCGTPGTVQSHRCVAPGLGRALSARPKRVDLILWVLGASEGLCSGR